MLLPLVACGEHAPGAARAGAPAARAGGTAPRAAPDIEVTRPERPVRGESAEDAADCETARARVRLRSPETARRAGIETAAVVSRPIARTIQATGVTAVDERRVARLSAPVRGIVRETRRLAGEDVEEGEGLAVIESIDLGEAKGAARQTAALLVVREKAWAIERELVAQNATSKRSALLAEAAVEETKIERERARQRLRLLGVPDEAIAKVESGQDASATIALRTPFAGTVLERSIGTGEVVEPGRPLYVIADLSRLLLVIDLSERDYPVVAGAEARVVFRVDGRPGQVFRGKLVSAGAQVDPAARVIRAVAEVKNAAPGDAARPLIPGMFGRAEISVGGSEEALLVPRAAVQWEGCHYVVFVEVREGFYQTRAVEPGTELGEHQEIRAGLTPGERVVTTGSYLLKTEILKGSIGAGCCD